MQRTFLHLLLQWNTEQASPERLNLMSKEKVVVSGTSFSFSISISSAPETVILAEQKRS